MISSMSFGVKQVRQFLADSGHVVTVRGYYYKSTRATVPQLNDAQIIRKCLGEVVGENDLKPFVPLSGFKTARDWMKQITRFCKGRKWAYLVKIDDNQISRMERDYEKREHQQVTKQLSIDDIPGFEVNRTEYKYMDGSTATEEYNIYDDMSHSLDIRSDPGLRDPADIDLQPFKDAAHADRIQREARRAERKRERMWKKYAEHGEIKTVIKAPRTDILMVTGNRWLKNSESIRKQLSDLIDSRRPDIAISGMAIGTDQLFAEICIEKGIPVYAYIPFSGQETRWPMHVQKRYHALLEKCEKKVIVCDSASIAAFQTRNVAMVHASTRAIAVRDYEPGGTENCIKVLDRESKPYTTVENK